MRRWRNPLYDTPQQAEAAFYDAFQRADFKAMSDVWANDDEVTCIHPMGPRLQGRDVVLASWGDLFSGGAELRFTLTDALYTSDANVSVHSVSENISYGAGFEQRSVVLATNVYRLTNDGWRICAHHGSPGRAAVVSVAPPSESETMH